MSIRKFLKIFLFSLAVVFVFPLSSFSQTEETLTIATYYPAPYGVYKTLRLYPNTDAGFAPDAVCSSNEEGAMSYDSDTKQVLVCVNDAGVYSWRTNVGFGVDAEWKMYIDSSSKQFRFQRNGEDKLKIDPYSGGIAIPRIHLILPSYVPPGFSGSPEVIFRYDPSTTPAKDWKIYVDMNDANKFKIKDHFFTSDRIVIDTAGNVGIGTASPTDTLTVSGTAWVTSSLWSGSDIRWKKNIQPIDNALSKVLQLSGVSYNWRKDEFPENKFDDKTHLGLIAQDVENIVSELVTTGEDGYKGLDYARVSALLVEAIKELKAENDGLKARIEALEAKLSEGKKQRKKGSE